MKIKNKISHSLNNKMNEKIKWVDINSLKFNPKFKTTYEQKPAKVELLIQNMKNNNFDASFPIIINSKNEIIDGNSRYIAAKNIGIKKIPVLIRDFSSDEEVINWQIEKQVSSRRLSESEIFDNFIYYEKLRNKAIENGENYSSFSNEILAEALSISPRQISKYRKIYELGTDDIFSKIKDGELSLNQAEKIISGNNKVKESKNKITSSEAFTLGIKYSFLQLSNGKKINEVLKELNIPDILDGTTITLSKSDLQLITQLLNK